MNMQSNSMNDTSINDGEKRENNFYDSCIQAILLNNDRILNKDECIKKINKLKCQSLR